MPQWHPNTETDADWQARTSHRRPPGVTVLVLAEWQCSVQRKRVKKRTARSNLLSCGGGHTGDLICDGSLRVSQSSTASGPAEMDGAKTIFNRTERGGSSPDYSSAPRPMYTQFVLCNRWKTRSFLLFNFLGRTHLPSCPTSVFRISFPSFQCSS